MYDIVWPTLSKFLCEEREIRSEVSQVRIAQLDEFSELMIGFMVDVSIVYQIYIYSISNIYIYICKYKYYIYMYIYVYLMGIYLFLFITIWLWLT